MGKGCSDAGSSLSYLRAGQARVWPQPPSHRPWCSAKTPSPAASPPARPGLCSGLGCGTALSVPSAALGALYRSNRDEFLPGLGTTQCLYCHVVSHREAKERKQIRCLPWAGAGLSDLAGLSANAPFSRGGAGSYGSKPRERGRTCPAGPRGWCSGPSTGCPWALRPHSDCSRHSHCPALRTQ